MKILFTGMSGVGKSSILEELAKRGFATLDLDYGYAVFDVKLREEILDIGRVQKALEKEECIFLAGCYRNQGLLYPFLDGVILLIAPLSILQSRIAGRKNNPYGKTAQEWQDIVQNKAEIEPLLAQSANAIVHTDKSLPELVEEILEIAKTLVEKPFSHYNKEE